MQNCSTERMQAIARQYSLPNTTSLTKEPLYHAVVSHMQTIRDCVKCGGKCDPMKHMFLPSKDPPTDSSPDSSPTALGRKTRSANATVSPTHAITSGDIPIIALVHADPSSLLFEGQPQGAGTSRGPPFNPGARLVLPRAPGRGNNRREPHRPPAGRTEVGSSYKGTGETREHLQGRIRGDALQGNRRK